jgi:DNA-binding CsgD family transcriptional regulator
MANLQALFEAISTAENERELRSQVVPDLGKYFTATRSGIFFFDQMPMVEPKLQKVFETALSADYNPVVRYLVDRHSPVHDQAISPKTWKLICPRPDHWHVLAGPLVNRGKLIGGVGFTRTQEMEAFNTQNLIDLSAICLHLSTWVATVRSTSLQSDRLTDRELEIATLVAQGLTNAEIGAKLWITENSVKQALKRMFRKLEVSSRAEMVAILKPVEVVP